MKFISVSEAALDSIQRMGEADKARIAELENTLRGVHGLAKEFSNHSPGMAYATCVIEAVLRETTDVQTIAKSEN